MNGDNHLQNDSVISLANSYEMSAGILGHVDGQTDNNLPSQDSKMGPAGADNMNTAMAKQNMIYQDSAYE